MPDDEARAGGHEEDQDEVEAHKRHAAANEEPGDEARAGETDDDVEAHGRAV